MKVISGFLKGKNIKGYNIEGTRPTMDRVKESVFAMIQNNIKDSVCLDLFAGSGNLGIEAISNGSKYVYFIDNNKIAIQTIKDNLNNLNIIDKCQVMLNDYKEGLQYFKKQHIKLDLIFIDPPYNMFVANEIMEYISFSDVLNNNGQVIVEYQKDILKDEYNNLKLIKNKKYGDTRINIYNKSNKIVD